MLGEEDLEHLQQHTEDHNKVMPALTEAQLSSDAAGGVADGDALAAAAAAATVAAAEDDDDFEKAKQEVGEMIGVPTQTKSWENGGFQFQPKRFPFFIVIFRYRAENSPEMSIP